jgi:hypothetical protein
MHGNGTATPRDAKAKHWQSESEPGWGKAKRSISKRSMGRAPKLRVLHGPAMDWHGNVRSGIAKQREGKAKLKSAQWSDGIEQHCDAERWLCEADPSNAQAKQIHAGRCVGKAKLGDARQRQSGVVRRSAMAWQ